MQEIKNAKQESRTQGSKKLFKISWTVSEEWIAMVRAKDKEEAHRIWERGPEQFWLNIHSDHKEITSEPHIEEVDS